MGYKENRRDPSTQYLIFPMAKPALTTRPLRGYINSDSNLLLSPGRST